MSAEEIKEGHYKDKYGRWQPDRRSGDDRRAFGKASPLEHERRKLFRRKLDREIIETDHRKMIDDALDDFAQEHDGHL
jgi:hypothetical protein